MSGELEKSLRDEVNNYVNSRLSEMQEELAGIESQLSEAFSRLRERAASERTDNMYVATAISEHIRAAHERGVEEAAAESARTRQASDMALIKAAVEDLDDQRSQADILNTLVNRAAAFAPRVAFFVIRNEQVIGWRARGFEGSIGDEGVREISLPLSAQTPLSEVARSRATWSGAPGHNSEDHLFLSRLGAEPPQHMVSIPLVVRGRCVAVLYADSAALDSDSINLEALETLVRVGSMAVELLAVGRPAPAERPARMEHATAPAAPPPQSQPEQQQQPQPAQPSQSAQLPPEQASPAPSSSWAATAEQPQQYSTVQEPSAQEQEAVPAFEHQQSQQPSASFEQAMPGDGQFAPTNTQETTIESAPVTDELHAAPTSGLESSGAHAVQEAQHVEVEEKGVAPFYEPAQVMDDEATLVQEAPPDFNPAAAAGGMSSGAQQQPDQSDQSGQYAAPLGGSRQYGGADMELPLDVGDDERRLHNDARRFARLLVSEIKLYNEQKVREGRSQGDIYERLREDIDRSRQMYDKRVAPPVAARYDYFHQELVNTLAEGDPSKLGHSYTEKR